MSQKNLWNALKKGDAGKLRKALAEGGDPNCSWYIDEEDEYPLHWALEHGEEMTRLLLDAGALVDQEDAGGKTPLLAAARSFEDETSVVELLLNRGANIEARDLLGSGAMHHAADWGNCDIAEVLLRAGIKKPGRKNKRRESPQSIVEKNLARQSGNPRKVEKFTKFLGLLRDLS